METSVCVIGIIGFVSIGVILTREIFKDRDCLFCWIFYIITISALVLTVIYLSLMINQIAC